MLNYYRANYPKTAGETTGVAAPDAPPIKVPVLVIHGMKDTALNAIKGAVMKASAGTANPQRVDEIARKLIG